MEKLKSDTAGKDKVTGIMMKSDDKLVKNWSGNSVVWNCSVVHCSIV